jgi:multimeric flavodoxin WrbA
VKAVIFIGSLKASSSDSNTVSLCKLVQKEFKKWGVNTQFRYLRNRPMAHGVDMDTGEDWDEAGIYYDDVESSDIIMMATPIWWGIQSSLISQLMERIGAYDDVYLKDGQRSPLYSKVFGCVITASNDGFQQVQGNLYAFASNLGMTVPPEAHVTWGTVKGGPEVPVDNPETRSQIEIACRNLYMWAKCIKDANLAEETLKHKTFKAGLDSDDKLITSEDG